MIHIFGDYYLTADNNNFILTKKCVSTPNQKNDFQGGKVRYENIGYYQRMSAIYDRIVRECEKDIIMYEEVETLRDFIDKMSGVIGMLEGTIREFERVTIKDVSSKDSCEKYDDEE